MNNSGSLSCQLYKERRKQTLSKYSVHYVPSHGLVFMHIDIFFRLNTIDDVSQRGISWKKANMMAVYIYFRNVQNVSFNSWNNGIFVLFPCGVYEFIEVLHGNIVLRYKRRWHRPQSRSFVILLTAWSLKRPHKWHKRSQSRCHIQDQQKTHLFDG